jgi:hypothetical protein
MEKKTRVKIFTIILLIYILRGILIPIKIPIVFIISFVSIFCAFLYSTFAEKIPFLYKNEPMLVKFIGTIGFGYFLYIVPVLVSSLFEFLNHFELAIGLGILTTSIFLRTHEKTEGVYQTFDLIAQDKLKENDIVEEINIDRLPGELQNILIEAKRIYPITSVKVFQQNLIYRYFTLFMMMPVFVPDKYFFRCQLKSDFVDELILSKCTLCFVNYRYSGEKFYPVAGKKIIHSSDGEIYDEFRKIIHNGLAIQTFDRPFKTFSELVIHIKKYSFNRENGTILAGKKERWWGDWKKCLADFRNGRKPVLIFRTETNIRQVKTAMKSEYFTVAELVFKKILTQT